MIEKLKRAKYYKLYLPHHFNKVLLDQLERVGKKANLDQSLEKTFQWIKASFDANKDGGSSVYYRFGSGWKGSYPETTG